MPALGPILRLSPSGSQSSDDITAWLFTAAVRPHQEVKRCCEASPRSEEMCSTPPELGTLPPRGGWPLLHFKEKTL